ncbi:MAG: hypothetical protein U1E43_04635 [Rhodospirillales bacterium]
MSRAIRMLSATTKPSFSEITRRAKPATELSWVTRMMVMPLSFSRPNSPMISRPVRESSVPVGLFVNEPRLVDQRPRDRHLLAAGELARHMMRAVGKSDFGQHLGGAAMPSPRSMPA